MTPGLPSAFKFLSQHPLDLLVSTQPAGGADKVRGIRIYYGEHGSYYSFEFRLQDAQFGGDRSKMLQAAVRVLLAEVKSRALLAHDFSVWYYEDHDRVLIHQELQRLTAAEPALRRVGEKLLKVEKLVQTS